MLEEIIRDKLIIKALKRRDPEKIGKLLAELNKETLMPSPKVKDVICEFFDRVFVAFRKEMKR